MLRGSPAGTPSPGCPGCSVRNRGLARLLPVRMPDLQGRGSWRARTSGQMAAVQYVLLSVLLGTCASLPLSKRRLTSRHSGNRVGLYYVTEERQPCLQNDPVAPAEPGNQVARGQTPTSLPSPEHSPHPKSTSAMCVAARCPRHCPTSRSNSHRLAGGDGGVQAPLVGRVPPFECSRASSQGLSGANRAPRLLPKSLPLSVPPVDSALCVLDRRLLFGDQCGQKCQLSPDQSLLKATKGLMGPLWGGRRPC